MFDSSSNRTVQMTRMMITTWSMCWENPPMTQMLLASSAVAAGVLLRWYWGGVVVTTAAPPDGDIACTGQSQRRTAGRKLLWYQNIVDTGPGLIITSCRASDTGSGGHVYSGNQMIKHHVYTTEARRFEASDGRFWCYMMQPSYNNNWAKTVFIIFYFMWLFLKWWNYQHINWLQCPKEIQGLCNIILRRNKLIK